MTVWTKTDYEFFAQVLYDAPIGLEERARIADDFSREFRRDKPRFDGARFADAVHSGMFYRHSGRQPGGWTERTYEMTARVLRRNRGETEPIGWNWLVTKFASEFARDNPRFSWSRFEDAATKYDGSQEFPEMERAARFAGRRPDEVRVHQYRRRA